MHASSVCAAWRSWADSAVAAPQANLTSSSMGPRSVICALTLRLLVRRLKRRRRCLPCTVTPRTEARMTVGHERCGVLADDERAASRAQSPYADGHAGDD